jgi:hypothetical protein
MAAPVEGTDASESPEASDVSLTLRAELVLRQLMSQLSA